MNPQKMDELAVAWNGKQNSQLRMMIGFDGFVDEILHVVDKRHDFDSFDRVETIDALGKRISQAAGLSANIEFVPRQVKLGGNGPIFANALLEYGVSITYAGALGCPDIHPVFKSMADKSTVYSFSDPGHTDALEFSDGKLLLGKLEPLLSVRYEAFKVALGGLDKVVDLVSSCDLLGMVNWTMIPYMSEIWEGLIKEVLPLLPDKTVKPIAFFDLADPEKRKKEDIFYALHLIGQFDTKFRTFLGLNEKEAYEIAAVCDITVDESLPHAERLQKVVTATYEKLGIYCLVVHPTKEAMACTQDGFVKVDGPFCQTPVLTTGAGDNFNAGFCFAQCIELDIENSLLAGVATSGYYVRNAKSPTFEALPIFLHDWKNDAL